MARTKKALYKKIWISIGSDSYEEMTDEKPDMTISDEDRVDLYFKACIEKEESEYLTVSEDTI